MGRDIVMNRLAATLAAALAVAVPNWPAAQEANSNASPLAQSAPVEAAWNGYRDTMTEYRKKLLATEAAQDPEMRAQLLYFLHGYEVLAYNYYMAPRQQYPVLYKEQMFMPLELSWGLPNPDFLYRHGTIDGAHTYRIYGNRGNNRWATLQMNRGFWGDDDQSVFANVDFDELPSDKDGNFEIFLGPNPPSERGGRYWVALDPTNPDIHMTLREVFYDWANERPMDIHIEALDRDPKAPIFFDMAELKARLNKAQKYLATSFEYALAGVKKYSAHPDPSKGTVPHNVFITTDTENSRAHGGNPLGYWVNMLYDIKPGEALIIEMSNKQARYWGFQLGTLWQQTTDYSYHQSSINAVQARLDSDGKFRAVLSLEDPGVPNWLDPVGVKIGSVLLRFYKSDGYVVPSVRKVAFKDIRKYLPKDTPIVTTKQRKVELETRRRASLRRYGQ